MADTELLRRRAMVDKKFAADLEEELKDLDNFKATGVSGIIKKKLAIAEDLMDFYNENLTATEPSVELFMKKCRRIAGLIRGEIYALGGGIKIGEKDFEIVEKDIGLYKKDIKVFEGEKRVLNDMLFKRLQKVLFSSLSMIIVKKESELKERLRKDFNLKNKQSFQEEIAKLKEEKIKARRIKDLIKTKETQLANYLNAVINKLIDTDEELLQGCIRQIKLQKLIKGLTSSLLKFNKNQLEEINSLKSAISEIEGGVIENKIKVKLLVHLKTLNIIVKNENKRIIKLNRKFNLLKELDLKLHQAAQSASYARQQELNEILHPNINIMKEALAQPPLTSSDVEDVLKRLDKEGF